VATGNLQAPIRSEPVIALGSNFSNSRFFLRSRIPHYHAQEATDAMKPLLGEYYHSDKTSYWGALWKAFTECQWIAPDPEKTAKAVRFLFPPFIHSVFSLFSFSSSASPPTQLNPSGWIIGTSKKLSQRLTWNPERIRSPRRRFDRARPEKSS
jgi:hypothetical protein